MIWLFRDDVGDIIVSDGEYRATLWLFIENSFCSKSGILDLKQNAFNTHDKERVLPVEFLQ